MERYRGVDCRGAWPCMAVAQASFASLIKGYFSVVIAGLFAEQLYNFFERKSAIYEMRQTS